MKSSSRISLALFSFSILTLLSFLLITSVGSQKHDEPFTISTTTEYGISKNTVHVTITDNVDKDNIINISNVFKRHSLTDLITYDDVLMLQNHSVDVYGWENISQGKYKAINTTCVDTGNETICTDEYLDDSDVPMDCDYLLGDKSCMKLTRVVTETVQREDYLPISGLKEKVVIDGKKIEQKQEGIVLPKDGTVHLKFTVSHPVFSLGFRVPDDVNKYNITVCSTDGQHCSILDPEWWNKTWINKQEINLTVTSGTTVKNYQVLIQINNSVNGTNWNWSNECIDDNSTKARFLNGSEQAELDFWIQNCSVVSQTMEVWVEVDDNITTTPTNIYLYYNSEGATPKSSISDTFLLGDDFEDGVINDSLWIPATYGDGASYNEVNGYFYLNSGNEVVGSAVLESNSSTVTFKPGTALDVMIVDSGFEHYRTSGYTYDGVGADGNCGSNWWWMIGKTGYTFWAEPTGIIREYLSCSLDDNKGSLTLPTRTNWRHETYAYNTTGLYWEYSYLNSFPTFTLIGGLGDTTLTYANNFSVFFARGSHDIAGRWGVRTLDNVRVRYWHDADPYPSYVIGPEEVSTLSFSDHNRSPKHPNEDQDVMVNVTIDALDTVWLEFNNTVNNDAVNWTVITEVSSEYYYTIPSVNYTAHDNVTYVWYANDTYGNLNRSKQQSFIVANRPPSVPAHANPANNSGVALGYPVPEFNWSATDQDDEDNITSYTFEIYYSNDTRYNQTTTTNNYTALVLPTGFDETYYWQVRANDSRNVSDWSGNFSFQYANWSITFNATDSVTKEIIPENTMEISCDNGFSATGKNPYNAIDAFAPGTWACTFSGVTNYYSKEQNFTADNDATMQILMSSERSLTEEEHTWLEWLYDCWNSGTCKDLLEAINLTTTEISETVEDIWNQYKRTNQSVVTSESILSKDVNATSNLTISYSIDVPIKEGYTIGETSGEIRLDYLPIRISYWFLNYPNNNSCYSQGNYSVALAEPYCQPLTVYTIGQVNQSMSFTVDLRPSIPSGTYTIVRNIEIDPEQVWINYGQEAIGVVEVLEGNSESMISLKNTGTFPGTTPAGPEPASTVRAGTVSSVTGWTVGNAGSIIAVISVIAVLGIAGCFVFMKKRNQYRDYSYKSR